MIESNWILTCRKVRLDTYKTIPIEILKLLAKSEEAPGGPYYAINHNSIIPNDNKEIYLMLQAYDISLEPLNIYIRKHFPKVAEIKPSELTKNNIYLSHIKEEFEIEISKLPKEILQYWKEIEDNTFTTEVILLPFRFGDIEDHTKKVISIINLYGWLYFSLLDQQVDEKSFSVNLSLIKDYLHSIYISKLEGFESGIGINIVQEAIAVNLIEINSGVTEETVIIRSRPYYVALYSYYKGKKHKLFKQLDSYLLAKQYNDDIHDFISDYEKGHKTLITNQLAADIDIYDQFIEKIIPQTINKIHDLLENVKIKGFIYPDKLLGGVEKYEINKELYDKLLIESP